MEVKEKTMFTQYLNCNLNCTINTIKKLFNIKDKSKLSSKTLKNFNLIITKFQMKLSQILSCSVKLTAHVSITFYISPAYYLSIFRHEYWSLPY